MRGRIGARGRWLMGDQLERDWDGVSRTVQNRLLILFPLARSLQMGASAEGTRRLMMEGFIPRVHQQYYMLGRLNELVPARGSRRLREMEPAEVGVLLNAFYVNIVAALDCLAIAIAYELDVLADQMSRGRFSEVSLFKERFLSALERKNPELYKFIMDNDDWSQQVFKKRHPAAHRIPLSLTPRISEHTYKELTKMFAGADGVEGFDEEYLRRIAAMAEFAPEFAPNYHSSEGEGTIYPAIVVDSNNLIEISKGVIVHLLPRE